MVVVVVVVFTCRFTFFLFFFFFSANLLPLFKGKKREEMASLHHSSKDLGKAYSVKDFEN